MDPHLKDYIVLGFMLGPRIYGNSHMPWKLKILSAESQMRTQVPSLGKPSYLRFIHTLSEPAAFAARHQRLSFRMPADVVT